MIHIKLSLNVGSRYLLLPYLLWFTEEHKACSVNKDGRAKGKLAFSNFYLNHLIGIGGLAQW
jgi:hypothetical protein